ncbi:MAG: hypothetical protein ERJ67_08490 [Aphanocapsa feldmannii 277cV]|uniref:Uncharacterized protein n=2 Tax=Aphanocapsa feldmannii TaxID=192050 RepID=A0A524RLW9_9CHRO|nr:MAG: hypothetical protein ERJ67_08490 [Aphanocapsa feldmannii 277cV]TGH21212.1 MAG: hypothetical protein ERJ68_05735 [Aphanocapsa feldmannii 277cI]
MAVVNPGSIPYRTLQLLRQEITDIRQRIRSFYGWRQVRQGEALWEEYREWLQPEAESTELLLLNRLALQSAQRKARPDSPGEDHSGPRPDGVEGKGSQAPDHGSPGPASGEDPHAPWT